MKSVKLPTTIKLGDKDVTELTIREPRAGELRGLEVVSLLRMDYTQHRTLIPRVCPALTVNDVDNLSPKNLVAIQQEIVGFFVEG